MVSVKVVSYLLYLVALSGLLQLTGFVSPGWVRTKFEDTSVQKGLWYVRSCVNDVCETTQVKDDYTVCYPFRPYQIQTSIALLACLMAGISLVTARRNTDAGLKLRLTFSIYFSLLSGILALIPAGYDADKQIAAKSDIVLFPYSLFLTGLGGIIALITSLVALFIQQIKQTKFDSSST